MSEAESFIPLRRCEVLELCARDHGDPDDFRAFGRLLRALLRHQSPDTLIGQHCNKDPDLDVHNPLRPCSSFKHDGPIVADNGGHWPAATTDTAKATLDRHWDGLFDYSKP